MLIAGCFLLTISGCGSGKRVDQESVAVERLSREIKKVTDAELMVAGETLGLKILNETQSTFQNALMTALQEQGVEGAITYCNLNAYELVRNYEDSLGIRISRVTDRPRNPADTLSAFEQEVFEAYQYAPELATAQLQELDEQTLILNKPIMITNGICLNCHGRVGTDINKAHHELIRSLYPDDQAVNYAIGDLRGMWSLKIPKKTVVDQL